MPLIFAVNVDDLADGGVCQMPSAPHVAIFRVGDDFYMRRRIPAATRSGRSARTANRRPEGVVLAPYGALRRT